jgi:hypothetical protein
MEVVRSSETHLSSYHAIRHHIPADGFVILGVYSVHTSLASSLELPPSDCPDMLTPPQRVSGLAPSSTRYCRELLSVAVCDELPCLDTQHSVSYIPAPKNRRHSG